MLSACLLVCSTMTMPAQPSLQIQPGAITLTGPNATQRLLVHRVEKGDIVADVTERAELFSANPKVAVVADGVVKAVGDGETTISASQDDMNAKIKVKVIGAKEPAAISFTN